MTEPTIQDKIKRIISDEDLVGGSVDDIGADASLILTLTPFNCRR